MLQARTLEQTLTIYQYVRYSTVIDRNKHVVIKSISRLLSGKCFQQVFVKQCHSEKILQSEDIAKPEYENCHGMFFNEHQIVVLRLGK